MRLLVCWGGGIYILLQQLEFPDYLLNTVTVLGIIFIRVLSVKYGLSLPRLSR